MADQTELIELAIARWRGKATVRHDLDTDIVRHNTALPTGITGNVVVSVSNPSGTTGEFYVPAAAASDSALGTSGDPICWLPPTGSDLTGNSDYAIVIEKDAILRFSVATPMWWMIIKALLGTIASRIKLGARLTFASGVPGSAGPNFASEIARDTALPSPATSDKCVVDGIGEQTYYAGAWNTLASSTPQISSWKEEVVAASTAALTLATDVEDGDTLDGVTLATGDRILLKDQADASENGIYAVSASGAPTRTSDFDASAEVNGAVVVVAGGTANVGTLWVCSANNPTIGTDDIPFTNLPIIGKANNTEIDAGGEDTKFVSVAGIVRLLGNLANTVHTYFVSTRAAKTMPVDADSLMVCDSADLNKDKKTTIAQLQSTFSIEKESVQSSGTVSAGTPVTLTFTFDFVPRYIDLFAVLTVNDNTVGSSYFNGIYKSGIIGLRGLRGNNSGGYSPSVLSSNRLEATDSGTTASIVFSLVSTVLTATFSTEAGTCYGSVGVVAHK